MYGLTETKRTLYLPPEQLDKRPGSVGIAIPGTEVWLEDEDGNRLGPGEVGELVVRGRHVMRGYWEAPEATAARYRPGPIPGERLCYTGDLFRMDEEGYLYFVSRKDDIIKSFGYRVSPYEVERVLKNHPAVADCACIAEEAGPDKRLVVAYVIPQAEARVTVDELLAFDVRHAGEGVDQRIADRVPAQVVEGVRHLAARVLIGLGGVAGGAIRG
jgi:acyl-coenzyme A synthetase/AMP-(fatty) acid ligase